MTPMEEYMADIKLYNHPTVKSALYELNRRMQDVKWVMNNIKFNVKTKHSEGMEAEKKNAEIIQNDIDAINNGANPEDVMRKYHFENGSKYGLSGYQLYEYNFVYPSTVPDV